MVRRTYIPDAGDLVWATFDPQAGHEQSGRRPAIVMTPSIYNERAGLALTCPITSKVKDYPFEIAVTGVRIKGVILADQVRSMDWRARQFAFIERAHADVLDDVRQTIGALLRLD